MKRLGAKKYLIFFLLLLFLPISLSSCSSKGEGDPKVREKITSHIKTYLEKRNLKDFEVGSLSYSVEKVAPNGKLGVYTLSIKGNKAGKNPNTYIYLDFDNEGNVFHPYSDKKLSSLDDLFFPKLYTEIIDEYKEEYAKDLKEELKDLDKVELSFNGYNIEKYKYAIDVIIDVINEGYTKENGDKLFSLANVNIYFDIDKFTLEEIYDEIIKVKDILFNKNPFSDLSFYVYKGNFDNSVPLALNYKKNSYGFKDTKYLKKEILSYESYIENKLGKFKVDDGVVNKHSNTSNTSNTR